MRRLPKDAKAIFDERVQEASLDLQRKDSEGNPTIIRWERDYELITPLFGGGVEPTKPDPITIVRVTEIRGQLRFWWRAIRGGQFGSDAQGLQSMKLVESAIWGAASTNERPSPSQVQIIIKNPASGDPRKYSLFEPELQYAAFPLQKGDKEVLQDVAFTLQLSFPRSAKFINEDDKETVLDEVEAEVNAALWAWETFGGLGARTRRGFGAIGCLSKNDGESSALTSATHSAKDVKAKLVEELSKHMKDEKGWPKDVPHLSRNGFNYRVTGIQRSEREAWKKLIGELKRFRQQRPEKEFEIMVDGRPKTVKEFGRSHWPEADAIRNYTGQWVKAGQKKPKRGSKTHPGHVPDPKNSGKFPRAVFGLPIVFHFKDNTPKGDSWGKDDDPRDVVLALESHDRLASPLILRPLCISEGQYVGLAVLLEGGLWPEDFCCNDTNLILMEKDDGTAAYIAEDLEAELVVGSEADAIKEFPSGKSLLRGGTNPLIAFLDRIQKEDNS